MRARNGGDTSLLGCPAGHGIEAARELAKCVDVLVEWGVHDLASVCAAELPASTLICVGVADDGVRWAGSRGVTVIPDVGQKASEQQPQNS
jgi:hypothetical protein